MIRTGLALVGAAFALALFTAVMALQNRAWGHGDAAWIMANPSYVDADGMHCCGPSDCNRELAMYFREAPEGVYVISLDAFGEPTESLMPRKLVRHGLYGSIDDDWWICQRGGVVKCVFKPTKGT